MAHLLATPWASFPGEFWLCGRSPSRMRRQGGCEPGSKGRSAACWGLSAGNCLRGCSSVQIRRGPWQLGASRARCWGNLASLVLGGRWWVCFWGWLLLCPAPSRSQSEHELVAPWETLPRTGLFALQGIKPEQPLCPSSVCFIQPVLCFLSCQQAFPSPSKQCGRSSKIWKVPF